MNVLPGHRKNRRVILLEYTLAGASALTDVAFDAALETDVFTEIDEDLGTQHLDDLIPIEGEESFDDDELSRLDEFRFFRARVRGEIVDRFLNGIAAI